MSSKPRVLIVDDEERFRTTMGKLLAVRGLDVGTVGSGKEALEELKKGSYDVIVLDIRMPEMGGIEALREIKRLDPKVEVIVLTGHASVDVAVEIMKLGGYEYLLKPCSVDDLMDKIESAYEKKLEKERRMQKDPTLI
jgi:DNA-binding NtrC family response regulator